MGQFSLSPSCLPFLLDEVSSSSDSVGSLPQLPMGICVNSDLITGALEVTFRRTWQPTPVFLPGESCGQGSLVDCCPWGRTELDTTEGT